MFGEVRCGDVRICGADATFRDTELHNCQDLLTQVSNGLHALSLADQKAITGLHSSLRQLCKEPFLNVIPDESDSTRPYADVASITHIVQTPTSSTMSPTVMQQASDLLGILDDTNDMPSALIASARELLSLVSSIAGQVAPTSPVV